MVPVQGRAVIGGVTYNPTATLTINASTGFPGASNTGVPAGTTLTASTGDVFATTNGQVIQNRDIKGSVYVRASNVVIKNCKIHGNGTGNGVEVNSGNVTVQDTEIYNFENGIAYTDWTALRVNIHSTTGDGVKIGSNTLLQDSWLHDFTPGSGSHTDGAQMQDGSVNVVIRHNTITIPYNGPGNGAIYIQPIFGPSTNGPVMIEDNYLSGGGFTVYIIGGANAGGYTVSNITVRNNKFGHEHEYGASRVTVPVTWTNNVYLDTGLPV
jgi:hypothetical protein